MHTLYIPTFILLCIISSFSDPEDYGVNIYVNREGGKVENHEGIGCNPNDVNCGVRIKFNEGDVKNWEWGSKWWNG